MRQLGTITLLVLIWLTASACQSTHIALPTHNEPPGTDLGGEYLAGEIRLEKGCLKLYRIGWNQPNRSVSKQIHDIWLPVWPPGFTLQQEDQEIHVVDSKGALLALAGDMVRLGGGVYWSEENKPEELEKNIPKECQGPYYLVGDEVSVVPKNEATVVPLQSSSLWFPRTKTGGGGPPTAGLLAEPPSNQTLTLDGDCLRIGKEGPVLIWPAGFYPDMQNGHLVVRNGGGVVVATVGQEMKLDSGGYITGNSGPCRGPLWGGTRFLETLLNPQDVEAVPRKLSHRSMH